MYPSDYKYTYALGIDYKCYSIGAQCLPQSGGNPSEGWLFVQNDYQWFLTSTYSPDNVLHIWSDGRILSWLANVQMGVKPTLYLKPEVKIK